MKNGHGIATISAMDTPDRNDAVTGESSTGSSTMTTRRSSTRSSRPPARTAWIVVAAAVAVAVAIALIVIKPWAGDGDGPTGDPVRIDRGSATEATLAIDGSVRALTITADAPSADLLTADATTGQQPTADGADKLHLGSGDEVALRLAPDVAWTLEISSSLDTLTADLGAGKLSDLTLAGGTRTIELTLPKPDGAVTIDQPGGAQDLAVHLPDGVGAQVDVTSGIGTATVDGKATQGVGSGTTLKTEPLGDDRYELKVGGGLSTLTIDHP